MEKKQAYKIVYYDEFINDFGGIEKGIFWFVTDSKAKIEYYKNYEYTYEISKTKMIPLNYVQKVKGYF